MRTDEVVEHLASPDQPRAWSAQRMANRHVARTGSEAKVRVCIECDGIATAKAGKAVCKDCSAKKRAAYLADYMAEYRVVNAEKISANHKDWLARNAETEAPKARARTKAWIAANPERSKASQKACYYANPEPYKLRSALSKERRREEDIEGYRAKATDYARKRRASNPKFVIADRMSNRIWYALRSRGRQKRTNWIQFVDYTIDQLRDRLNETMPTGYSWNDFMAGVLHIDHIRPVASFAFESEDDPGFKECWALTNLRLLPGPDNIAKGARLDWDTPA